jgi:uncharacterized repeat protein (TIGR03803 family)
VSDQAGNLYGVTVKRQHAHSPTGSFYKLSPGEGGWTEETLYSFTDKSFKGTRVGETAASGIVLDAVGNIYGTTGSFCCSINGSVYELVAPVGGVGNYTLNVLGNFNGSNGLNPSGTPIVDKAGNLYGTTFFGGSSGYGVVYEVNSSPVVTTLTSSPNPSVFGQVVTFTAVVTSGAGAPPDGETVSFMHGKTLLGTGTLSGGSASFTTSDLKVGATNVTAMFSGNGFATPSISNTVKQVVKK